MLAALVGVNGTIERHIGRFVVGDNAAAGVGIDLGADFSLVLLPLPAVIEGLVRKLHEAGSGIAGGATAFYGFGFLHGCAMCVCATGQSRYSRNNSLVSDRS